MWNDVPQLTMPVLLVTGTRDEKYTAIARRMLERMHPGVGLTCNSTAVTRCRSSNPRCSAA